MINSRQTPFSSHQVFSIKAYSGCLDRRWKSTTSRTPLREVRRSPEGHTVSGGPGHGLSRLVCLPGNDPLIDEESNHDINSVAGVLKLYFRGLENPLFPKERFNDLISCVREYHCLEPGTCVLTV